MQNENTEETFENPVEEETIEIEETSEEEQETSEPAETKEEVEASRNKLYKRLKDAERDLKALKEKKASETSSEKVDIVELSDKMAALSGLDAEERTRLIREAELQGTSLSDARKSQDFKFWRSAYRVELKKNNAPEPSTKQSLTKEDKPWDQRNIDEQVDWIKSLKILDPKTGQLNDAKWLPKSFYQEGK